MQRDGVQIVVGPASSAEALAIHDYMGDAQTPLVSPSALAEDLTQRKASPWFVRATSATGQLSHVLGDYAANTLKYRKVATIAQDFAYGYEIVGGFQRVFEDNGGVITKKIWVPLNATDYSSYISQIGDVDAVYASFSGPAAQNFLRQYAEFGYKDRIPLLASHSTVDESLLPEMGTTRSASSRPVITRRRSRIPRTRPSCKAIERSIKSRPASMRRAAIWQPSSSTRR